MKILQFIYVGIFMTAVKKTATTKTKTNSVNRKWWKSLLEMNSENLTINLQKRKRWTLLWICSQNVCFFLLLSFFSVILSQRYLWLLEIKLMEWNIIKNSFAIERFTLWKKELFITLNVNMRGCENLLQKNNYLEFILTLCVCVCVCKHTPYTLFLYISNEPKKTGWKI